VTGSTFTDQATADAVLYHTATVRDYARELTEEEQALGADNFAIKHIKVANYANIDTKRHAHAHGYINAEPHAHRLTNKHPDRHSIQHSNGDADRDSIEHTYELPKCHSNYHAD
jgi:hypothetical protein